MPIYGRTQLNFWFRTLAKPLATQFAAWQDSYWHKLEDLIPMTAIDGLTTALASFVNQSYIDTVVANEATIRANADNAEAATRAAADLVLQANIDAEAILRADGDTDVISTLRDGVTGAGNTLKKLYNLILGAVSQVTVADTAARDAYNVPRLPFNIFVTDDGDSRWALYAATTTGVVATFIKLSDPDLLNAVMSAAQIKIAYESNADTNCFTNALLAKLDAIAAGATANSTDAYLLDRANHTGNQTASTIIDFNAAALAAAPAETDITIGALVNGAGNKTTPVNADHLALMDSADSNKIKKLSWTNFKAALKTYFDTLYQSVSAFAADVRLVALTGLSTATNSAITAVDTVISALGKLQRQITDNTTTIGTKADKATTIEINGSIQDLSANRTWTVSPLPGSGTYAAMIALVTPSNGQMYIVTDYLPGLWVYCTFAVEWKYKPTASDVVFHQQFGIIQNGTTLGNFVKTGNLTLTPETSGLTKFGAFGRIDTGITTTGVATIGGGAFVMGSSSTKKAAFIFRVRIPTLSTIGEEFHLTLGNADSGSGQGAVAFVYHRLSYGTNWQAVSSRSFAGGGPIANATTTFADCGATYGTVDTNFHDFVILFDASTNVRFYIDGNLVATITTNIPTTHRLFSGIYFRKTAGSTARNADIDYLTGYIYKR